MTTTAELPNALSTAEALQLRREIVDHLRRQAVWGSKCIFMNCEMHETAGGMTTSADLFSVTKPLFRLPKRNQWVLDAELLRRINRLGRLLMQDIGRDRVTLDLIVDGDGSSKLFVDSAQPRLLDGEDFYKSKHKAYAAEHPLLAALP